MQSRGGIEVVGGLASVVDRRVTVDDDLFGHLGIRRLLTLYVRLQRTVRTAVGYGLTACSRIGGSVDGSIRRYRLVGSHVRWDGRFGLFGGRAYRADIVCRASADRSISLFRVMWDSRFVVWSGTDLDGGQRRRFLLFGCRSATGFDTNRNRRQRCLLFGDPIVRFVKPAIGTFRRCDPNSDGKNDIADAVWIVNELFRDGPPTLCREAADCNDDGMEDLSDAIFAIEYQFLGGSAPPAPFPDCGSDPDSTEESCPAGSNGDCP